jgi:hypothetical protein
MINAPRTYTLEEIETELLSGMTLAQALYQNQLAYRRLSELHQELQATSSRIMSLANERLKEQSLS